MAVKRVQHGGAVAALLKIAALSDNPIVRELVDKKLESIAKAYGLSLEELQFAVRDALYSAWLKR